MDNKKKGILYMITASVSFAIMAVMVKLSGGEIPLFQQVFFRNFVMIIFSGWMISKEKRSIKVAPKDRLVLFLRCSLGLLGVFCVFYANNHLILSDAQILQKLNPFFVILFAVVLLGEPLTLKKVVTLAVGFTGALIIINPTGQFDPLPALVGVLSALFGGLAYLMIRKLKGRIHGMVIIFYFSLLSILVTLPMMLSVYVAPTAKEWLFLLLIGVFAAFGQYFITKAYMNAKAGDVTLFDYAGVIVSPILGLLIFQEAITLRTLSGMAIIIGAGIVASQEKQKMPT